MSARLVVTGSGSLARSICAAIADTAREPIHVTVVARSAAAAREVTFLAGTRARLNGVPAWFRARAAAFDSGDGLARIIADGRAQLVLHCASEQSPWEVRSGANGWTDFVARAGFGVTLPLHAQLARVVAGAIARSDTGARLVNACFPDAVNVLLRELDLPVLCGVGNAATLFAAAEEALRITDPTRLHVLAHHVHLSRADPADDAQVWLDGRRVEPSGPLFAELRAADRRRLNTITSLTAALLVRALIGGGRYAGSVPGPFGLPGGYPVRVADGILSLAFPPGIDEAYAVGWNRSAGARDGVDVHDGRITFTGSARTALAEHLPGIAEGFPLSALPRATSDLLGLRTRLRAASAARTPLREAAHDPTGAPR